jgi:hypothetical protein
MRRFAIISLLLLTLAACGGREPLRPLTLKAVTGLDGSEAMAIEVRITEIPPGVRIERIAAVDPGGGVLAASELLRSESETGPGLVSRPSLGLAVTGGSSSGVNPSLALGINVSGGGPSRRSRQVTARIPLPDPAAYRSAASEWRIEVHYSDVADSSQVLTLPAPRLD